MDVTPEPSGTAAGASERFSAPPRTVLLVDDVQETRTIAKLFLSSFGYIIDSFASATDALAHFDSRIHDLVVTDNSMQGISGEELAHIIKMRSASTPVLMYTGNRPADRSCLDIVIEKPVPLTVLKEAVDRLFALRG
jgi:DNA-binding NtrC family response regulator